MIYLLILKGLPSPVFSSKKKKNENMKLILKMVVNYNWTYFKGTDCSNCYLSADKGCPPDCEESGESPECLMWVTLKPWKDTWDTFNVPLLHAPILLEFGEISLTLVNCRFFFSIDSKCFNYESLEILLKKIFMRVFFSGNPFALLIKHIASYIGMGKLFLSLIWLCL